MTHGPSFVIHFMNGFVECRYDFKFFSTDFSACLKPPRRENYCKTSYPKAQQRDQGAGWTQKMKSDSSWRLGLYPLGYAVDSGHAVTAVI